ncbi:hypothetical protein [Nocardioides donggukensis]|uniref:Uncharacterized protein n=1 Tax=Nocardioides donggukensis TaxID=2774019 RepID=A0A927K5H8_9ACTN|nr:hypothetical protein [Nocardioides donggukensis]MBD8870183.1 hypothetical protein [Nocardioides donggukensis]
MDDDLTAAVPRLDAESQRALGVAETWLGDDVQGVGIGATEAGDRCVVVHVLDPTSEQVRSLPEECEGLPVRIEPGDGFRAGG